ncbi:hypothetical protein OG429_35680 [Streptomyces sp. NBC_00190]|nr:hypothetical protein [Streptomyces sp. NBC_00190]WSZ44141.1 hypothetical protein OG239_38145 [Streptomyces sp. NBC_00868]
MSSASPDKILLVAKDRTLRTLLERLLVGGASRWSTAEPGRTPWPC